MAKKRKVVSKLVLSEDLAEVYKNLAIAEKYRQGVRMCKDGVDINLAILALYGAKHMQSLNELVEEDEHMWRCLGAGAKEEIVAQCKNLRVSDERLNWRIEDRDGIFWDWCKEVDYIDKSSRKMLIATCLDYYKEIDRLLEAFRSIVTYFTIIKEPISDGCVTSRFFKVRVGLSALGTRGREISPLVCKWLMEGEGSLIEYCKSSYSENTADVVSGLIIDKGRDNLVEDIRKYIENRSLIVEGDLEKIIEEVERKIEDTYSYIKTDLKSVVNWMYSMSPVQRENEKLYKELEKVKSSTVKEKYVRKVEKRLQATEKELVDLRARVKNNEVEKGLREEISKLRAEIDKGNRLEQRNSDIEIKYKVSLNENQRLKIEIEKLKAENDILKKKVNANKNSSELSERELSRMLNRVRGAKVVIVGGPKNFGERVSSYLRNVRVLDVDDLSKNIVIGSYDVACIYSDANKHSAVRKLESEPGYRREKVIYLSSTNKKAVVESIYKVLLGR